MVPCYRNAAIGGWPTLAGEGETDRKVSRQPVGYISVCSEISNATSTSIPKYRTVRSNFEWPGNSYTVRKFFGSPVNQSSPGSAHRMCAIGGGIKTNSGDPLMNDISVLSG